jgi:uncharacterized membrane protein
MAKRNRDKVKSANPPRLKSISTLEVFAIHNSLISITVEVYRKTFSLKRSRSRENSLRVKIENTGETDLGNLAVDFLAPKNLLIADPGIGLGTTRRHIRLPLLRVGKSTSYKLAITPSIHFESGILKIQITETSMHSTVPASELRVGLTTA